MSPPTVELQQAGQETPQQGWKAGGAGGAGVPQHPPPPLRMARLESLETMQLPPGGLWMSPSRDSDCQVPTKRRETSTALLCHTMTTSQRPAGLGCCSEHQKET